MLQKADLYENSSNLAEDVRGGERHGSAEWQNDKQKRRGKLLRTSYSPKIKPTKTSRNVPRKVG